jgi:hypothetical protein
MRKRFFFLFLSSSDFPPPWPTDKSSSACCCCCCWAWARIIFLCLKPGLCIGVGIRVGIRSAPLQFERLIPRLNKTQIPAYREATLCLYTPRWHIQLGSRRFILSESIVWYRLRGAGGSGTACRNDDCQYDMVRTSQLPTRRTVL